MAKSSDNKLRAVVDIVTDGDVILVVGPQKARLRVHSLTLKEASEPLSAMLGLNRKEGDVLREKWPLELLLPEDNAMVMEYICAIIHHPNNILPSTMTPHGILEVAITATKYNFVDALRFASKSWLQTRNVKADELMALTAAAYAFQNAQAFRDLTKALILNYGDSYLALSTERIESVMNWKVFCKVLIVDSTGS
ncbi:uncharacterized protein N7479_010753 [Penicillium vulpinum]|uniref:BTB domain-containing protein n=1 Tax=Penicillium vulpinum TaxID=29845 RepID=A0A1V6S0L8_9EURO|nr:uncharacterized protein N7479_010753 [Penicillium vulpinum]KAJ5952340.1 hypothetical protein N7479_010753 [Penicillium vulpinum]OQE07203.1 hypothetical protein PENVUL_c014G02296 [Penicillium vulpinum]